MTHNNIDFTVWCVEKIFINAPETADGRNPMCGIPFWYGDNCSFYESVAVA